MNRIVVNDDDFDFEGEEDRDFDDFDDFDVHYIWRRFSFRCPPPQDSWRM
jgi:hypothetical protein